MKTSLLSVLLLLAYSATWSEGFIPSDLSNNTNMISMVSPAVADNPDCDLAAVTACYPPDWQNCYNIGQNSCTWSWGSCYGAHYYWVQWRYPGGSWYNFGNYCYQTWCNVSGLNACTSYEWRVCAYCDYGYSSWCYPYGFNTLCNYCETPYGCYTDNNYGNSATFHWNTVWGAQDYCVQISTGNGYWIDLPNSPCNTNYITCYNLQPGTDYQWRVRAHCGYNNYSNWTYINYFTCYGSYCSNPDWLQCYNITGYSATWKWSSCYGADYYWLQWRVQGGNWCDYSGGPCYGTWVNVYNLQPCTTYEWRVRTHCSYGYNNYWCNPYVFTTSCTNYCQVPYNMYTKDIGDYQATCKWSAVDGAMSYTVQMRSGGGSWYDVPGGTTTGTWITVGNLTSCKYYEWRVRSNCYGYGYSNWCNTMSFTCTCGHGCHAPEWVYTAGISPNSGTCHWAPVSGADSYVVEWRASGGTWNTLAPVTNPYLELTGLNPSTTYEWHVKCHCPSGYSDWSSIAYFNTSSGASCGLPFWRYTLPITDSTATFNWAPVPGAVDYIVQIHAQGNNPWQDVLGSPTTNTSITAKGLTPNTAYEWRMQVNCGNGAYSYWLSSILFYTGATAGCGTPSWLYADNISLSSATLNWAAVPGALFYTVDIRITPSGSWKPIHNNPVTTNSVTIDSLNSYTTYDWRVKAHCAGGTNSYDSYGPPFSTNTSLSCHAPDGLSVNNITETAGTFRWNSVAGALGYEVQSRLPNENWIDFSGGILNDTSVAVTGFTPNTSYEWRVRTKCDTSLYSNWSSVSTFKTIGTNPLNEDCATATELTVGTSCVPTFASNVDAQASTPAPVGGCYTSGYKDVWFKFTMPDVPNPAVTIRTTAGSLANAVMEVYSGTDCGIMSFIACEDNNDNGNGSSMPVINLTGTPKANIWVRVWGYDGATGTFSICVFSGISINYVGVENTENADQGEPTEGLENAVVFSTEGANQPDLTIVPNPVNDQLYVTVKQTAESHVVALRILDLSGKTVESEAVEPNDGQVYRTILDVYTLVPGIYVLQVQTTSGVMAEKVSVVH